MVPPLKNVPALELGGLKYRPVSITSSADPLSARKVVVVQYELTDLEAMLSTTQAAFDGNGSYIDLTIEEDDLP